MAAPPPPPGAGGAGLLELERDRLAGALRHLERSVAELECAIAEGGPDPEYRDAISEDLVVIAKYRARIAALEDEIRRARGLQGGGQQLAATPAEESGSGGEAGNGEAGNGEAGNGEAGAGGAMDVDAAGAAAGSGGGGGQGDGAWL